MKYLIFAILLLAHAGAVFSQVSTLEVISQESTYLPFQDSLLIKRTVTITETEIEAINDTLVSFSEPTDSAGLAQQLVSEYLNVANQRAAIFRRSSDFRYTIRDYNATKAELNSFGLSLDSVVINQYSRQLLGTYRVFLDDSTNYIADMQAHPTRSDVLRLVGRGGETPLVVFVLGNGLIRLRIGTITYLLSWDGNSTTRKAYRHTSYFLPSTEVTQSIIRILKIE